MSLERQEVNHAAGLKYAILGNFRLSVSVFAGTGTIEGGAEMIRDLFIAVVMLILTVTATAWLNGGSRLSVQQVEASLAR